MSSTENPLAAYVAKRIDALVGIKTQREIAAELGYDMPNIISMWKHGTCKIPLGRIPALARAIHGDPAHMWRLCVQQLEEGVGAAATEIFGALVSRNEADLIAAVRLATDDADPSFDDDRLRAIAEVARTGGAATPAVPAANPVIVPLEPIAIESAAASPAPSALVDLNFKVAPEFHRQFKLLAVQRGLSMKEVLLLSFAAFVERDQAGE
jgi:hypothetical protein